MLFLSFVKGLFYWLFPLAAIWVYLKYSYNVGIIDTAIWWYRNYSSVDYAIPLLIAFLFTYFAVFATSSHVFQSAYIQISGEKYSAIFLGNSNENVSEFISEGRNANSKSFRSDANQGYTYTFRDVYRDVIFTRDRGSKQIGAPVEAYSTFHVLLSILLLCIFSAPMVAVLHMFAYPVAVDAGGAWYPESMQTLDAFKYKIHDIAGISISKVVFMVIALFIILIALINKLPKSYTSAPSDIPLSNLYTAGRIVSGVAIKSNAELSRISTTGGGYRYEDHGIRNIVLRFDRDLKYPVFVSYRFNSFENPNLASIFDESIKNQDALTFELGDSLELIFSDSLE